MTRFGLTTRTAALTAGVALVAVVIAGAISVSLVGDAARDQEQVTLSRQADVVAGLVDRPSTGQLRAVRRQGIALVRISATGEAFGSDVALAALGNHRAELQAGHALHYATEVDGRPELVEARGLRRGGGIALVQAISDASGLARTVLTRTGTALLVGLLIAVLAGVFFARRITAPLRRAAHAAGTLAAGRRDVALDVDGPPEVREVAAALNTLSAELATSESRQREFLLSVSHELRTPLTAVRGFAEALADGVIVPAEVPRTGATILAESERLDRLVEDLLQLARLGAQDFPLDLVEVDLVELIRAAGTVWRTRCAADNIMSTVEYPSAPLVVRTDPIRLRQIVDGLAENALRVTPEGAPIVLAVRAGTDHAVVEIRDGGPGLTPEDCEVAFERSVLYERYRGLRRVGTGLGLALVHGLVVRLGGTVEAGRAAEGGARFTVRLPRRPPAPGAQS